MELIIKGQDRKMPEIEFNFEELKEGIIEAIKPYQNLIFTDDTIRDAKATVADLRKLRRAIDDKRKDVKREYTRPLKKFEGQVKELTGLIDGPIDSIAEQIADYEERQRSEKLERCRAFFEEVVKEHGLEDLRFEQIEKKEFGNASKSPTKIKEEITAEVERIAAELESIDALNTEFSFELKTHYMQTLDLPDTMRELKRLNDLKAAKAAAKAEQEAREQARQAAKAAAKAEQEAREQARQEEQAAQEEAAEEMQAAPTAEEAPEPLYTIAFKATGTREQLKGLSDYMKNNGIHFEEN